MLLYTHAFNDAREAQRQPPVNAFWVHGAGALAQAPMPAGPVPQVDNTLQDAALRQDWSTWQSAWHALDAGAIAQLERHVAGGGAAQLTLCGERGALSWHTAPRSLRQKISSVFKPQRFADVRNQL